MPRQMTVEEREAFLAEPRVAVLAVASDDGRPPHAAPTWYAYEPGGLLTIFTGSGGRAPRKTRLIERAGVVSLSVQHPEPPYRYVTVEGSVIAIDREHPFDGVYAIVRRYLPEEMARGMVAAERDLPDSRLVLVTIRPDRWLTGDFGDE